MIEWRSSLDIGVATKKLLTPHRNFRNSILNEPGMVCTVAHIKTRSLIAFQTSTACQVSVIYILIG